VRVLHRCRWRTRASLTTKTGDDDGDGRAGPDGCRDVPNGGGGIWTKDLLKVYFDTRNGMIGADYSTKFTP